MDSWWRRKKAIIVQIVMWWDRLYEQFGNACTVPLAFQVNFFSGGAGSKIPWRRGMLHTPVFLGFPMAQLVKNLPAMQETWVGKIPWGKEKATHFSILAWRIPWMYSPWGRKKSDTTEQLSLSLSFKVIDLVTHVSTFLWEKSSDTEQSCSNVFHSRLAL